MYYVHLYKYHIYNIHVWEISNPASLYIPASKVCSEYPPGIAHQGGCQGGDHPHLLKSKSGMVLHFGCLKVLKVLRYYRCKQRLKTGIKSYF